MNKCYKEVNVNPTKKRTGDCVIRAIANAENREWTEIFDELVKLARELYSVPNNKTVYGKYLEKYPTVDVKFVNDFGEKRRLTPSIFKDRGLKGTYICKLAGHLTCVRDDVTEDTWDCSYKCCYKIWKVK